jgi:hypothetical protein
MSMVCQWFSLKTTETVCQWFGLKAAGMVFSDLASKLMAWVFRFGPQNWHLWFSDLGLKITATISWFGHQTNEVRFVGCTTTPIEGGRHGTRIEIYRLASSRGKSR